MIHTQIPDSVDEAAGEIVHTAFDVPFSLEDTSRAEMLKIFNGLSNMSDERIKELIALDEKVCPLFPNLSPPPLLIPFSCPSISTDLDGEILPPEQIRFFKAFLSNRVRLLPPSVPDHLPLIPSVRPLPHPRF